jgi:hypothetical protein
MKQIFIPTLLSLLTCTAFAGTYSVKVPLEIAQGGRLPNNSIIIGGISTEQPTNPGEEVEEETPEDELGLEKACLTDVRANLSNDTYGPTPSVSYSVSYKSKACSINIVSLAKVVLVAEYQNIYNKVFYAGYMGEAENEGLSVYAKFSDNPTTFYSSGGMTTTHLYNELMWQKCSNIYNSARTYAAGKDVTLSVVYNTNYLVDDNQIPNCQITVEDNVYPTGSSNEATPEYLENCVVRNNVLNDIHHYIHGISKPLNLSFIKGDVRYNHGCSGSNVYQMTQPSNF